MAQDDPTSPAHHEESIWADIARLDRSSLDLQKSVLSLANNMNDRLDRNSVVMREMNEMLAQMNKNLCYLLGIEEPGENPAATVGMIPTATDPAPEAQAKARNEGILLTPTLETSHQVLPVETQIAPPVQKQNPGNSVRNLIEHLEGDSIDGSVRRESAPADGVTGNKVWVPRGIELDQLYYKVRKKGTDISGVLGFEASAISSKRFMGVNNTGMKKRCNNRKKWVSKLRNGFIADVNQKRVWNPGGDLTEHVKWIGIAKRHKLVILEEFTKLLQPVKSVLEKASCEKMASGMLCVFATLGLVPVLRCIRGGPVEMVASWLDQMIESGKIMGRDGSEEWLIAWIVSNIHVCTRMIAGLLASEMLYVPRLLELFLKEVSCGHWSLTEGQKQPGGLNEKYDGDGQDLMVMEVERELLGPNILAQAIKALQHEHSFLGSSRKGLVHKLAIDDYVLLEKRVEEAREDSFVGGVRLRKSDDDIEAHVGVKFYKLDFTKQHMVIVAPGLEEKKLVRVHEDEPVIKAFYKSEKAHKGQTRAIDDPNHNPCVETAMWVAHIEAISIVAVPGLLHDTVDYSFMSYDSRKKDKVLSQRAFSEESKGIGNRLDLVFISERYHSLRPPEQQFGEVSSRSYCMSSYKLTGQKIGMFDSPRPPERSTSKLSSSFKSGEPSARFRLLVDGTEASQSSF